MTRSRCVQLLAGGVALGAIALGLGWLNRHALLEATLEQNLSQLTGANTQIETLTVQPFSGTLTIQTLTLNNLEGFSSPHLLVLDRLDLQLDPKSLFQDTVEIQALEVEGVEVNLEQKLTQNNLAAVFRTLEEQSGHKGTPSDQTHDKKVTIDRLVIRNIDATLTVSVVAGIGLDQALELPDIELTHLTPQSAPGKVIDAVAIAITTAILNEIAATNQTIPLP